MFNLPHFPTVFEVSGACVHSAADIARAKWSVKGEPIMSPHGPVWAPDDLQDSF